MNKIPQALSRRTYKQICRHRKRQHSKLLLSIQWELRKCKSFKILRSIISQSHYLLMLCVRESRRPCSLPCPMGQAILHYQTPIIRKKKMNQDPSVGIHCPTTLRKISNVTKRQLSVTQVDYFPLEDLHKEPL